MSEHVTQSVEIAVRGHVLVIEPDAAYAERFPDAPIEYRWFIECANTDICGGYEECIQEHEVDGVSAVDGPWECPDDVAWCEEDYFTFHGVEHQWHYGWNWTVPFKGCVVKENADDCPIFPMRPGRWTVEDEWENDGEFMTLNVLAEQHISPGQRADS